MLYNTLNNDSATTVEQLKKSTKFSPLENVGLRRKHLMGFTLMETVMVLGIFILLAIILPPLFRSFNLLFTTQNNLADVAIQNEFAMDAIAEQTRQAKGVVASQTVNSTLYTTASTTIVLAYPVFDAGGSLVPTETSYGVFFINPSDPTKLDFTFEAAPSSLKSDITRTISNYVDDVIFRYNKGVVTDTTVVTAYIKTSRTLNTYTSSVSQTSAYTLRNK